MRNEYGHLVTEAGNTILPEYEEAAREAQG